MAYRWFGHSETACDRLRLLRLLLELRQVIMTWWPCSHALLNVIRKWHNERVCTRAHAIYNLTPSIMQSMSCEARKFIIFITWILLGKLLDRQMIMTKLIFYIFVIYTNAFTSKRSFYVSWNVSYHIWLICRLYQQ